MGSPLTKLHLESGKYFISHLFMEPSLWGFFFRIVLLTRGNQKCLFCVGAFMMGLSGQLTLFLSFNTTKYLVGLNFVKSHIHINKFP